MKSIYMEECWGALQQEKVNGIAETFVFEKDGMRITYPFIMRKAGFVDGVEFKDLVTPRGQCGPWIRNGRDEDIRGLVQAFDAAFGEYCEQQHIVTEYVRFDPWLNQSWNFSQVYDVEKYNIIYSNDLRVDFFRSEYSASMKGHIRKAESLGVQIEFDEAGASIEEFLELYAYTEDKYEVSDFFRVDRAFVERYMDMLPGKVVFAKALIEGRTISIGLFLMGEDIAHYHFGASDPAYKSYQGGSLMLYRTALYAADRGKKLFDLGGARKGTALETYKKGMARKHTSYIGTRIRNQEIYAKLVEMNGGPWEDYFPAYRKA